LKVKKKPTHLDTYDLKALQKLLVKYIVLLETQWRKKNLESQKQSCERHKNLGMLHPKGSREERRHWRRPNQEDSIGRLVQHGPESAGEGHGGIWGGL